MSSPPTGSPLSRRVQIGLLLLSASVVLPTAFSKRAADLAHYFHSARSFLWGATPYLDFGFEYPPYALLSFVPAAFGGELQIFIVAFGLQLGLLDVMCKAWLLRLGVRTLPGIRALIPLAVFTVFGVVQIFWYLKRYDLLPAFCVFVALLAVSTGRDRWAGALLVIGAGLKLYPALLWPVLFFAAQSRRRFIEGTAAAALPLLLITFVWPWWRFSELHGARGLQVESLPAALLWLGQHLGLTEATWLKAPASYEVHGAAAAWLLGKWKILWIGLTLGTLALAANAARRIPHRRPEEAAWLVLPVLLAFIAWSPVLSPQYLTWLMGPVALALLSGRVSLTVGLVTLAALLTPLIYPSPNYQTGLHLGRSVILVVRDLAFVAAWASSTWALLRPAPQGPTVSVRAESVRSPA